MSLGKSLLSGSTTLLILELLHQKDMYGYQMIEALEKQSNHIFTLKAGTLYPLLHTLEQEGLVQCYEQEEEGVRPRKYYHLTDSGKKALAARKQEWNTYASAVNRVLGGVKHATI